MFKKKIMQINIAKFLYDLGRNDYTTAYTDLNTNKDNSVTALSKYLNKSTAEYIVDNFLFLSLVLNNKENILSIDDYVNLENIVLDDLTKDEKLTQIFGICLLLYYYIIDESSPVIDSKHPVMKLNSYCQYVLDKYIYRDDLKPIFDNWINNFEDITNISYNNIYNYLYFFIEKAAIESTTINAGDINIETPVENETVEEIPSTSEEITESTEA